MKYITSITGLEFYSFHGLYAEEKLLGAQFLVDVRVSSTIDKPINSIDEAINYEIIFNTAKAAMALPQLLIETVAQQIVSELKGFFLNADTIEVTIHKPNPAGAFKSGMASVCFTEQLT